MTERSAPRLGFPVALGLLALLVVACGGPSPTDSVGPGASLAVDAGNCAPIDIRGPSGTGVRLTGAWRADDVGRYYIHQRESCMYWLGMSQDNGAGAGSEWTNVFTGTIRNDFTIAGNWGDVPLNPALDSRDLGNGSMVLRIDFDQSEGVEIPVLRMVEQSGFFGGTTWVPEESLSDPVELLGIFGGDDDQQCIWIDVDGERTEMIGSAEWIVRSPPLSVQDQIGQIHARVGDSIWVRGELTTVLGGRCTDTAILVEELDPNP